MTILPKSLFSLFLALLDHLIVLLPINFLYLQLFLPNLLHLLLTAFLKVIVDCDINILKIGFEQINYPIPITVSVKSARAEQWACNMFASIKNVS